jgi:PAS domain S-box-containing protein
MPYRTYFKAASEALIIVNDNGVIIEANSRAAELFGYQQQELNGQPVEVLVPVRLRTIHKQHLTEYFKAPRTRRMGTGLNLTGYRKKGQEFPIEVGLTFVGGENNVVVASVADLSERLALELEASRAAVRATVASAAAGIAHDIRNPLQAITLRTSALKSKIDSDFTPSTVRRAADAIEAQVNRAERIVGNLSLLAENGIKLEEKIDLNSLIQGAVLLVLEQGQKFAIRIDKSVGTGVAGYLRPFGGA